MNIALRYHLPRARHRRVNVWGFVALLLLPAALILGSGCSSAPAPAAEFVTQAEVLHQGALSKSITSARDVDEYFTEIGKRIIDGARKTDAKYTRDPTFANMQFHLVGSDIPNAFTTGGRHVYVYDGLFQLCDNEEELACVMAHEFAHAVDLDVQQTGLKPDPKNSLDKIAYAFVTNPCTAPMEQQADARGFEFYTRGGWDPAHYADIFERLLTRGYASPGAGTSANRVPLATRAETIRALARSAPVAARDWRQPPVADAETFRDLRSRAAAAASATGERATPQVRAWLYLRAFPNCLLPSDLPAQQAAQQQLRRDTTPPPAVNPPKEPS